MIKFEHNGTDTLNRMQFYTRDNDQNTLVLHGNGRAGLGYGTGTPTALLHLNGIDASGVPVLQLSQLDIDEPFINFHTTSASSGTSNAIITDTTTDAAKYGAIMISIGGTTKWIRVFDGPS